MPWAREGSGFALPFKALAWSMRQELPVRQAAQMLRVSEKQLWRQIDHNVGLARQKQDMSKVTFIGIDETSLREGHQYVTVVHDLDEKAPYPFFRLVDLWPTELKAMAQSGAHP